MKKLALIYNSEFDICGKISDYFAGNKDVSITVFYFDKFEKSDLLTKGNIELKLIEEFDDTVFDLIVFSDYKSMGKCNIKIGDKSVNLHPSLLPAFDCPNAISAAYNSGIKVGGISIHYLLQNSEQYKIIAQYPLLISNVMHFDEYVDNILELAGFLYPKVIEKLLDDKIFDFEDLLKTCNRGCGSCSGCGGHN